MSDEQQSGMSEEFKARMRQGLSSMAVRERVRERRRNGAIAGGAVAAVAAAVIGVGAWQFAGTLDPRVDQAAPPAPTSTIEPSAVPSTDPSIATTPTPTETIPPQPTPPPGFEGVASGVPIVTASVPRGEGGDTGAAGGGGVEREYDVYVLCEGTGTVSFGGAEWIDCTDFEEGTGWAVFGQVDEVGDGDPRYTASPDFDGELSVIDAGASPPGSAGGSTATVYYDCGPTVTIGGVLFDCDADPTAIVNLAAWGVPIGAGSFAPRVESDDWTPSIRWVVER
jgi:hypothetical protein